MPGANPLPLSDGPIILRGKTIAESVAVDITLRIDGCKAKGKRAPGLGVILVGNNPASQTYVASKQKFAHRCGLRTFDTHLPEDCTREQLHEAIEKMNQDPLIDGILLQLPLPKQLDAGEFIPRIAPFKDADGLHPYNQGLLMQGLEGPRPCTPSGVMALLDLSGLMRQFDETETVDLAKLPRMSLAGKKAVVIGRSQLVGKPMAFMLLERNATVTIAHSKTPDLAAVAHEADVIVAAVGVSKLVTKGWVKPGAIVLDVGINRGSDGALVGDVDYDAVVSECSAITPVPKGVGPTTVAMLIRNTYENYERRGSV